MLSFLETFWLLMCGVAMGRGHIAASFGLLIVGAVAMGALRAFTK